MKVCNKCKELKENYSKGRNTCKECESIQSKIYYKLNKEKILIKEKNRYKLNKENKID